MTPEDKALLGKFTIVAKKIIYDPERFKNLLQMMSTQDGAVHAVAVVIGAIEKHKHIPPQIAIQLAMNAYLTMVEMARDVTGQKPSQEIMQQVMTKLQQLGSKLLQQNPAKDATTLGNSGNFSGEMPNEATETGVEKDPNEEQEMAGGLIGRGMRGVA